MKFLAVLIATTLVTSLPAQTDRRLLASNEQPRESHAMAYDLVHGRCVLFGGRDGTSTLAATMLWDGQQWTAAAPAVEPPARRGHAMAYDLARARVVLFGGFAGTLLSDTWEWDGTTWSQQQPAHVPPARSDTAMAYSLTTARTVMFGGVLGNVLGDDTWEWDGNDWTRPLFGQSPQARSGHAMAYDLQHNRVVLFGGQSADPAITWQYDGFTWTAINTPTHPPGVQGGSWAYQVAMAFDFAAGRTLLLQTDVAVANPNPSALWSWDGAAWTALPLANAQALLGRRGAAVAYDIARARTVVFGGSDRIARGDTWEWDGTAWHTALPAARTNAAFAFDTARGAAVLFGGLTVTGVPSILADTWEWRDAAWHVLQPASAPSGRAECGAAFDSLRNVTVLFGGSRSSAEFDETWEWNGSNWNQRASSVRPPARRRPALAFDAARGEVVMFGGFSTSPLASFQDTWTWNGTTWTPRTPAVQPPPRASAAFAFDAARGRCVLFSGLPFLSAPSNDTWEWDGANWIARTPVHAPSVRSGAAFTYDAPRRRMVLIGGYDRQPFDETWEWDGVDWTERVAPGVTAPAYGVGVFDTVANRTLVFGSSVGGVPTSDTWSYGPVQPASIAPFGSGCAGSAGTPQLHADGGSLPWGDDTLALAVEPVPANAPVLLAIGFSNTTFGGASLPAALDAIGMTGCSLLVSIDDTLLAFSNVARADFALLVPTTTALAGLQFFAQTAVADAAANQAGIVASNALAGRIGSK